MQGVTVTEEFKICSFLRQAIFFFIELEQSLDPNTNSAKSLSNVFCSFHFLPLPPAMPDSPPLLSRTPSPVSPSSVYFISVSSLIFSFLYIAPLNGRTVQMINPTLFKILQLLLKKRSTRLVVLFVRSAEQASLFVTRSPTSLQ